MNRAMRRAAAKGKSLKQPHIKIPVTMRFSQRHETDLQLIPHMTLEKFREGVADESDWHFLALRLNWGRFLADEHFHEATQHMAEAQQALAAVRERHSKTGKWGASQPEFAAIGLGLNACDEMQLNCTRRELRDALDAAYRANEYITKKRPMAELERA